MSASPEQPVRRKGIVRWLHLNLFAKPLDTVLTLIVVPLVLWTIWELATWALTVAEWNVVGDSLKVLMTGIFPPEMLWLVWIVAILIAALMGLTTSITIGLDRRKALAGALVAAVLLAVSFFGSTLEPEAALMVLAFLALWGAGRRCPVLQRQIVGIAFGVLVAIFVILSPAGSSTWGGLLLSILVTLTAALLTIPIGVVLAFGRQSQNASLRVLSTAYIETMRSVPLILIVFCIWVAFPLVLPQYPIPDVIRGLIGFTLFYSAYAAEFIRSGLQSVDQGQREAAESIGLSSLDIKRIVILPQALRVAVPGLVGNILDIFNFVPLVFIIGLTDFLRAGQMILANPVNSGRTYEIYVFMFVVCFVVGSGITFQARRLERKLSEGARK